jgi:NADPH:quinone reductase-like Zn-dependent oxidoreductase
MKAYVQAGYGPPEVLSLQELLRPEPRDDEVLIRVHASSVNRADWLLLIGRPYAVRLAFGLTRPRQRVPGLDAAGRVESVGKDVVAFAPGDRVYAEAQGAFAEYACAPASRVWHAPANLTDEQAACVPVAGVTALQALRDAASLGPGNRVLINGAAGGVGTFAVQIARALGAHVTAVCSAANVEMVRSLGADDVIDYTREDFTQSPERFDAILDLVANRPLAACTRLLNPDGVFVHAGGTGMARMLQVGMVALFSRRVRMFLARPCREDLAALKTMIEAGQVAPVIDREFSLCELPAALRYVGTGHARAKCVIRVRRPQGRIRYHSGTMKSGQPGT